MILIVPMTLLSAITGVILSGGDNNVFTQIGLIVLVGLACKNAIVERDVAHLIFPDEVQTLPAAEGAEALRRAAKLVPVRHVLRIVDGDDVAPRQRQGHVERLRFGARLPVRQDDDAHERRQRQPP